MPKCFGGHIKLLELVNLVKQVWFLVRAKEANKQKQTKFEHDIRLHTYWLLTVVDVEFHPNPNYISSATKSEPSDNSASHLFGNGY